MGLFTEEGDAAQAIGALRSSPWKLCRVHGPYPSHVVLDALKFKKSRVGYFTLAGGITGFFAGYGLAIYSSVQWNLIVSGKPVVSLIPFFVVGYEMTILFGILGTVLGILLSARIPEFKSLKGIYDPRCSGEHFGVVASCEAGGEAALSAFFADMGAEVRHFEAPGDIGRTVQGAGA
jgi:molybdopterin-containing oxidoreductase family membrane subunit